MPCPLCEQRKARRLCPALNKQICAICCGTKRLVEIRCPSTCSYLSTAREHPAAVVRRQHEHDLSLLVPLLKDLNEHQQQLFFVTMTLIGRHKPEGFERLMDDDVAEAASALAQTLETSTRGVIYEQRATSLPAQHLLAELKTFVTKVGAKGGTAFERDAAVVMRAIERGARTIPESTDQTKNAFLALVERVVRQIGEPSDTSATTPAVTPRSPLIIT